MNEPVISPEKMIEILKDKNISFATLIAVNETDDTTSMHVTGLEKENILQTVRILLVLADSLARSTGSTRDQVFEAIDKSEEAIVRENGER